MRVGDVVMYTLDAADASAINRRRTDGESIARRMKMNPPVWPEGAQAHIGSEAKAGDKLPMLVTLRTEEDVDRQTYYEILSGQVFLNGNDTLFKAGVRMAIDDDGQQGRWHARG